MADFVLTKEELHVLSCGYLRKYLNGKNINPDHIAQIIVVFLHIDWKLDYFHDYYDIIMKTRADHGIDSNGKTIKCQGFGSSFCACFSRVSFPMIPNSGIYTIKIKIDKIDIGLANAVGMTCNTDDTNNSQSAWKYWYYSYDYIAWSTSSEGHCLAYGLRDRYQSKNIFTLSKFVYKSNNEYYKERLPPIQSGDTIILQYDSDKNILSFFKSNDDKLNASIINLPKNKTFYWIAGHSGDELSMTIL